MNKPIYVFFSLACIISWTIWGLMILSNRGIIGVEIPRVTHFSAVIGPFIGSIIAAQVSGVMNVKQLFKNLFKFKVPFKWFLMAILIPLIAYGLAATIAVLLVPEHEYRFNSIINAFAILFTLPFIVLGEELGWRGFLLTELQQKFTPLKSSLVIGVMWAVWHFPAFYVAGIFESSVQLIGAFLGFNILCMVLSILFTWVVNFSGGSVFLAVMMHSAIAAASSLTNVAIKAPVMFFSAFTLVFLLMAVLVVRRWRENDYQVVNASE